MKLKNWNWPFLTLPLLFFGCEEKTEPFIFLSKEKSHSVIKRMDASGDAEPLYSETLASGAPSLSPEGDKLAFMGEVDGQWDVHIYDFGSKTLKQITESPSIEGFPAWAPNGEKLAFMSSINGNRDIYITDVSGGKTRRLTDDRAIDVKPLWSPNLDSVIYFKSIRNGYEALYRLHFGQNELREIAGMGKASNMLKTIKGTQELSYLQYDGSGQNLMAYNELTGKNYLLLSTAGKVTDYDWSPGGSRLAIAVKGQVEIYNYDQETGLALDFIIENASYPAWSDGGNGLLHVKRVGYYRQVFSYDLGTGKSRQLTRGEFDSYNPTPSI
jgi:Tol biopolymer transport system component